MKARRGAPHLHAIALAVAGAGEPRHYQYVASIGDGTRGVIKPLPGYRMLKGIRRCTAWFIFNNRSRELSRK